MSAANPSHHGSPSRTHAGPRHREGDETPAPSHAERARTLLHLGRVGTLATLSLRQPGFPFASLMPYALDGEGQPLVLISGMAVHTANLRRDPRASLLMTQEKAGGDPLGAGRVTLMGSVAEVTAAEIPEVRELYLERHSNARHWVDYDDFAFFRMRVADVYFVGGFGVMGWVEARELAEAAPDPLAEAADGILEHMNADHADALALLARIASGSDASEAAMTSVDRLGFHLRFRAGGRYHGLRLPFAHSVESTGACRKALVEMVRVAREDGAVAGARAPAGH